MLKQASERNSDGDSLDRATSSREASGKSRTPGPECGAFSDILGNKPSPASGLESNFKFGARVLRESSTWGGGETRIPRGFTQAESTFRGRRALADNVVSFVLFPLERFGVRCLLPTHTIALSDDNRTSEVFGRVGGCHPAPSIQERSASGTRTSRSTCRAATYRLPNTRTR